MVQGNHFVRVESAQYIVIGLGHVSDSRGEVGEQALRKIESGLYHHHSCLPVKDLEGSYSLVVIDKTKNNVIIYRNIAGLPCIYYISKNRLTLFSDCLPCLAHLLSVITHMKLTLNDSQLASCFLHRSTRWGETLFKDIQRIMLGEQVWLEADRILRSQITKATDMTVSRTNDCVRLLERVMNEIIMEYAKTYPNAMNMFSGGVDSSYIQAHLSKYSGHSIRTCSVDLDHPLWKTEREYARSGSEFFQTDHIFVKVTPAEYPKLLVETISKIGTLPCEPQVPLVVKLFEFVKKSSSVVICGDCADCLFGLELCEDIDLAYLVEKAMPFKSFRWMLSEVSQTLYQKTDSDIMERLTRILELDLHDESSPKHPFNVTDDARFEGTCKMLGYGEVTKAISQRIALLERYKIQGSLKERFHSMRVLSCAQGMAEQFYQLASSIGLKMLFPYLDSRLIKAALSMGEARFPYRLLKTKVVVKGALRNYLPKELVVRKKSAWGLPRAREWLTPGGVLYPWVKELENSSFAAYMFEAAKTPNPFVWSLLNFNIWHNHFLGEPA